MDVRIRTDSDVLLTGLDPLLDVADGKDINSVAGVLKLFFRELREPLFPTQLFDQLINLSSDIPAPNGTLPLLQSYSIIKLPSVMIIHKHCVVEVTS